MTNKTFLALADPGSWLGTVNPGFGPSGGSSLDFFTNNLPKFIISAAVFILLAGSFIYLLVGGIMWITSRGNKDGLAKAQSTVTYALVGLGLGLLSFVFINILGTFFGVNLIGP